MLCTERNVLKKGENMNSFFTKIQGRSLGFTDFENFRATKNTAVSHNSTVHKKKTLYLHLPLQKNAQSGPVQVYVTFTQLKARITRAYHTSIWSALEFYLHSAQSFTMSKNSPKKYTPLNKWQSGASYYSLPAIFQAFVATTLKLYHCKDVMDLNMMT